MPKIFVIMPDFDRELLLMVLNFQRPNEFNFKLQLETPHRATSQGFLERQKICSYLLFATHQD